MKMSLSCLILIFTLYSTVAPIDSFAHRNALTPDQKEHLRTAQDIRVQTLVLTEKGEADSGTIQHVISDRLQTIGLTVVDTSTKPHDVVLKVKCEERRSSVAMTTTGGDADQPGAPSRIWKGPACQLTFSIDGQIGLWRQEVRTAFEDAWQEAKTHGHRDSGLYALDQLREVLRKHNFPIELLAEWKQAKRLAAFLTSRDTRPTTKRVILRLAKKVASPTMLRALHTSMSDQDLAPHAIRAMGFMGTTASPFLLDLLENSDSVKLKALAAQALGEIGAHSGDMTILPPLLAMMDSPTIDLQVQTEIVKAVGKIPDHQSVDSLQQLGVKAWTSRSNDPRMQDLREAIDWSLWQINPNAHTDE
jgi:hypothetical protein